jgi:hypothetical protein
MSANLWLGSPLALGAVASGLRAEVGQAAKMLGGDPEIQQGVASSLLNSDVRVAFAWLNLVPVLAPAGGPAQSAILIDGPLQLLGAFALINIATLLVSSLFLTVLSGAVRGEPFRAAAAMRRAMQVAGSIGLALLAILGMGLLLGLPFLAISAIIIATAPAAALPVTLAWYIACFWAYIYAGFTPEAILISRSGPLLAIRNSVTIVRRNLIGTLGLLVLSFLIASGLGVIWRQIAGSPIGVATAILGSAYVGSGLSAARLEFYRSQINRMLG